MKLERIPPGGSSDLHTHQYSRQFFFVLEGEARMHVGEETYALGVRHGVEVESGVPDRIEHAEGDELVFLLASAPRVARDDIWPKRD